MRLRLLPATLAAVAALSVAAPAFAADDSSSGFSLAWASLTGHANALGTFKSANRAAARYLKASGEMEAVVRAVNARWALPGNVSIWFSDEIGAGPAYLSDIPLDDGTKLSLIDMPGDFLRLELRELGPYVRGIHGLTAKRAMVYADEFVLAHEMGHALVDKLQLPITGREEDAVDGFAAYLLADNPRFGPLTALSAAMFFAADADLRGKLTNADFADEHSIDEQRVYQFLCWVYGSDPHDFRSLLGGGGLPRSRARECPAEWRQLNRSWDSLLAPYARTPAG